MEIYLMMVLWLMTFPAFLSLMSRIMMLNSHFHSEGLGTNWCWGCIFCLWITLVGSGVPVVHGVHERWGRTWSPCGSSGTSSAPRWCTLSAPSSVIFSSRLVTSVLGFALFFFPFPPLWFSNCTQPYPPKKVRVIEVAV
jgi:hypothetical protein